MNTINIINLIFINIIIWLALSYFWSHWTFKLFKPYKWLEEKKKKLINKQLESIEKSFKDKNQFYGLWYLLQQIDENMVEGTCVICGLENESIPHIFKLVNNERKLIVIDQFENKDRVVTKENCNGVVSTHKVDIEHVNYKSFTDNFSNKYINTQIFKGDAIEILKDSEENIALAFIDSTEYNVVYESLKLIYNKLSKGGIIIVHDYNHDWPEVTDAVNRFQASIKESFIAYPDMYGSVVMVKNK